MLLQELQQQRRIINNCIRNDIQGYSLQKRSQQLPYKKHITGHSVIRLERKIAESPGIGEDSTTVRTTYTWKIQVIHIVVDITEKQHWVLGDNLVKFKPFAFFVELVSFIIFLISFLLSTALTKLQEKPTKMYAWLSIGLCRTIRNVQNPICIIQNDQNKLHKNTLKNMSL